MVMGFMQQSGGLVKVDTKKGIGTTFRLYFPAVDTQKPELERGETEVVRAISGRGRILLAEDEDGVRNVLVRTLEAAGYTVLAANSGDEALSVFEADPDIDLLISDVVMPGSSQGPDLAAALRKQTPSLPVIFLSGHVDEMDNQNADESGGDIWLTKPVQRVHLVASVERAIERSQKAAG